MAGVTNYIEIKSNPHLKMSPDGDFFKAWVESLKFIHNLTKKEMEVLAVCLEERWKISKKYPDDIIDTILLSNDRRKIICERCHIKPKHLNVVLSKFRKNGVIDKNEKFYLFLIPVMDKEGARLLINFNFKNEQQFVKLGPKTSKQRT
jgi:hypothetical protein